LFAPGLDDGSGHFAEGNLVTLIGREVAMGDESTATGNDGIGGAAGGPTAA
jgi:hypothetical protein